MQVASHSDLELAISANKGDREAQASLYYSHCDNMFGVCHTYVKDDNDATEILQKGFIKVFQSLKNYKGDGPIAAWIRRIMINTALDHIKLNKKKESLVDLTDLEANLELQQESMLIDDSLFSDDDLINAVKEIKSEYRLVFNLYNFEGLKHTEIAEKLDIKEETSRSRLHRAKSQIKEKLSIIHQNKVLSGAE